jgi:hypothetical protein
MHQDVIQSDIHSTDTFGYSEVIFALTHLLGFEFAPRIKNFKDQQLYALEPKKLDKENPNLILTEIPEDYPHEVYLYGKKIGRIGRKLGHLNVLNNQHNFNEFSKVLDSIREGYDL